MPLLFYSSHNETKAQVTTIFHNTDGLNEEELTDGIIVGSIPEPEVKFGKLPNLYINPTTSEMWYEYIDAPLTPEEKIEQLETQIMMMSGLLNSLLLPPME